MQIEVVYLPRDLAPRQCAGRSIVVFDVLRATTTMTAALASGIRTIRIFESSAEARAARALCDEEILLCGEEKCLPPPGFDLGNSPRAFSPCLHKNKSLFMSTTNGTRAILVAVGAERLLVGALVNARAVAGRLLEMGLPATLLCAGTNGRIAMEDILGAGAVLAELEACRSLKLADTGQIALRLFKSAHADPNGLRQALHDSSGGQNIIAAGLEADIDYAARLSAIDIVGEVRNLTVCISADPPAQTTLPAGSTPT